MSAPDVVLPHDTVVYSKADDLIRNIDVFFSCRGRSDDCILEEDRPYPYSLPSSSGYYRLAEIGCGQ